MFWGSMVLWLVRNGCRLQAQKLNVWIFQSLSISDAALQWRFVLK